MATWPAQAQRRHFWRARAVDVITGTWMAVVRFWFRVSARKILCRFENAFPIDFFYREPMKFSRLDQFRGRAFEPRSASVWSYF
jgi:hypothetical protein